MNDWAKTGWAYCKKEKELVVFVVLTLFIFSDIVFLNHGITLDSLFDAKKKPAQTIPVSSTKTVKQASQPAGTPSATLTIQRMRITVVPTQSTPTAKPALTKVPVPPSGSNTKVTPAWEPSPTSSPRTPSSSPSLQPTSTSQPCMTLVPGVPCLSLGVNAKMP